MHDLNTPLPDDLAKPQRTRMSTGDRVGVITGGGLLLLCLGLLAVGVALGV